MDLAMPPLPLRLLLWWTAALLAAACQHTPLVEELGNHYGRQRVLLVFAPSPNHAQFRQQVSALEAGQAQWTALELVAYGVFEAQTVTLTPGPVAYPPPAGPTRTAYQIKDGDFQVILIGVDGDVHTSQPEPLSHQRLVEWLHTLPIRLPAAPAPPDLIRDWAHDR